MTEDRSLNRDKNSKSPPRRPVHVRIAYCLVAAGCTVGFLSGSWKSWVKYQHEPLTSTTEEVAMTDLTLPSLTICPYTGNLSLGVDNAGWTVEEAIARMDMVPISIEQG